MNRTTSFVESAPNPVYGHAGMRGGGGTGAAAPTAPSGGGGGAAGNPLGLLGELRAVTAARAAARRAAARAGASGEFFLELDKPATAGVPVREMMTQIFMHQRSRAAKEFMLYFVYVLIFAAVVLQINPSSTINQTNAALYNAFLDQEFPPPDSYFKKTFNDIGDYGELQQWLTDVLVPALYPTQWYNGQPYSHWQSRFLFAGTYYEFVGGVRLWQVRVASSNCTFHSACPDADWAPATQARAPFGPPDDPARYRWEPAVVDEAGVYAFGLEGWGQPYYGTSGYLAFLPADGPVAAGVMDQLINDTWIDAWTRALIVDFTVYNAYTDMQSTLRFQVETPPHGNFLTSFEFFTSRRALYVSPSDILRLVGEVLLVTGSLWYLTKSAIRLSRRRKARDGFAWFEVVVQVLALAVIAYWVTCVYAMKAEGIGDNLATDVCRKPQRAQVYAGVRDPCWLDYYWFGQSYKYALTFAGVVGLLMALKFFAYFSIYHSLSLLWITLARAGMSLLAFCVGFCLLVAGFAFMGCLCFGHIVPGFHTWQASFSTLLRYPLGDFSYADLSRARPAIAGVFFAAYMALVFLVCINMVVAIITIAFEEVTESAKVEEKWKHAGRGYFGELRVAGQLYYLLAARFCVLRLGCCTRRKAGPGGGSAWRGPARSRILSSVSSRLGGGGGGASTASTAGGSEAGGGGGSYAVGSPTSVAGVEDDSVTDAAGLSLEDAAALSSWWGAEELALLAADAYYAELMAVFIETAEYTTRQDLMKYSEEVYHSAAAGTNYYIGLNELCEMARDPRYLPEPFCSAKHPAERGGQPSTGGGGGGVGSDDASDAEAGAAKPRAAARSWSRASSTGTSPAAASTGVSSNFSASFIGAPSPPRKRRPRPRHAGGGGSGSGGGGGGGGESGGEGGDAGGPHGRASRCGCCSADACGAWKSWYIDHLDFRVGEHARRGWCDWLGALWRSLIYADLLRPLHRRAIAAGLAPSLYAAASFDAAAGRCVAWRLVAAYRATRRTVMYGRTRRHVWISQHSVEAAAVRGSWRVAKANPVRSWRKRVLSIVQESSSVWVLLNYEASAERRLRRRLLLTQVVQADAVVFDPRRLLLYIEARDHPPPGRPADGAGGGVGGIAGLAAALGGQAGGVGGGLGGSGADPFMRYDIPGDACYDLTFASREDRDSFLAVLQGCRTQMQTALTARAAALHRSSTIGGLSAPVSTSSSEGGGGSGGGGGGGGPGGGAGSKPTQLSAMSRAMLSLTRAATIGGDDGPTPAPAPPAAARSGGGGGGGGRPRDDSIGGDTSEDGGGSTAGGAAALPGGGGPTGLSAASSAAASASLPAPYRVTARSVHALEPAPSTASTAATAASTSSSSSSARLGGLASHAGHSNVASVIRASLVRSGAGPQHPHPQQQQQHHHHHHQVSGSSAGSAASGGGDGGTAAAEAPAAAPAAAGSGGSGRAGGSRSGLAGALLAAARKAAAENAAAGAAAGGGAEG